MIWRYYSRLRPISIGCCPTTPKIENVFNYDYRTVVENIGNVWGYVEYKTRLTKEDIEHYSLIEEERG